MERLGPGDLVVLDYNGQKGSGAIQKRLYLQGTPFCLQGAPLAHCHLPPHLGDGRGGPNLQSDSSQLCPRGP